MKKMSMKSLLAISATTAFFLTIGAAAKADPVTVTFTPQALQNGLGGQTLTFDVNVLNTSTDAVNFDSDQLNIGPAGNDLVTNDEFFANSPFFLAPAGGTGDADAYEAFTVFIPTGTPGGVYDGSYVIQGDIGGSIFEIGSATFYVDVTPEPSTWVLMGTGLLGLGALARRKLEA